MKKSLVQILQAPLARFMHIGRESFEKRLEVPSTSRAIVSLKTLGILVVGPQHYLEAQDFVGVSKDGPSCFGGSGSNMLRCFQIWADRMAKIWAGWQNFFTALSSCRLVC